MSTKHYNALISPDAYEYLDSAPEDLLKDPLLAEQEELDDSELFEDETEEQAQENSDDSDMYRYNSLFDEIDNEEESSGDETEVTSEQEQEDKLIFRDEDDDSISVVPEIRNIKTTNDFIQKILKQLPKYDPTATLLSGLGRELQDDIEETVDRAHSAWMKDGKDKMFVIPDTHTSIAILSQTYDPMVTIQRLENIGAVMVSNDQGMWNALMLYYANDGSLAEVNTVSISPSSFTDWQWKTVLERGNKLRSLVK